MKKNIIIIIPFLVTLTYLHIRVLQITGVPMFVEHRWLRAMVSLLFDALSVGLISYGVCLGKRLWAYCLANTLALVWAYVNIIYATYFSEYLPIAMVSQTGNLADLPLATYVFSALRWYDLLPLLVAVAPPLLAQRFCTDIWRREKMDIPFYAFPLLCIIGFFISLKLFVYEGRITLPNRDTLAQVSLMPTEERLCLSPLVTVYETGIIRGQVFPAIFYRSDKTLSAEERSAIDRYIASLDRARQYDRLIADTSQERKNLVFIIAETYLAATADAKIGGREVTPFLNALRRDDSVIVNDSVCDNTGIGGSSDGQYIYMTGLLPLRNRPTISIAANRYLMALPAMLRGRGYTTLMTNPCQPGLWNQNKMCYTYGLSHHYSQASGDDTWIDDREMFRRGIRNEQKTTEPFFHLMLTVSTHRPYDVAEQELRQCGCHPKKCPRGMHPYYFNYLLKAHYMDHALQEYFASLKSRGLDKSTIVVIASDHGWQEDVNILLKPKEASRLSFIIAGAGQTDKAYVTSAIDQIDVFTSVADLLDFSSSRGWLGLGHSIFRPETFHPSVRMETWEISSDILLGNYWNTSR